MNTDRLDYLRIKYTRLNMKAGAQNKGLCRGRAVDMYTEHEFTDEKIKVERREAISVTWQRQGISLDSQDSKARNLKMTKHI